ncbi:hypothetical protein [Curtobacterium flaccumfaciens]|uniref:hypothetical protein n=1 Tax=Curtobacterium flaccumfaciens TaxID=2035 RepID=UPI0021FAAB7E|nr:hypothetical protein [Curtobacterium flaccumfaciens]UWD79300.1 hypothetical protein NY058_00555 [Curtobacterium flaccumfaciens]
MTLFAAAVAVVLLQATVRAGEASLAALWVPAVLHGRVLPDADGLLVWSTPDGPVRFVITTSCTVIVLIVPMLLLAAALLLGRRAKPASVGFAALVCAVALVAVSQLRLAVIAVATQVGGLSTGFELAHVFIGSFISILGFAASAILLVLVGTHRRRR